MDDVTCMGKDSGLFTLKGREASSFVINMIIGIHLINIFANADWYVARVSSRQQHFQYKSIGYLVARFSNTALLVVSEKLKEHTIFISTLHNSGMHRYVYFFQYEPKGWSIEYMLILDHDSL